VDGAGNLYISEQHHNRVRKVSPSGVITTLATVSVPDDLAVDAAENVYVSAAPWLVQGISPAGVVTTVAGNGSPGSSGDGGPATSAELIVEGLTVDAAGNLYIAGLGRVRRVDAVTGVITTVAGSGDDSDSQYIADTYNSRLRKVDVFGTITTLAEVSYPEGVAVDPVGRVYVAGAGHTVYRVDPVSGAMTDFAGGGVLHEAEAEGRPATEAFLGFSYDSLPVGMVFDRFGNLYLSDSGNNRIVTVDTAGILTTVVAGDHERYCGYTEEPNETLHCPTGLGIDPAGNLYVAEPHAQRLRKVDPSGNLATVPMSWASVSPVGVAVDGAGNVFFSDPSSSLVFRVDPQGNGFNVAGESWPGFDGDGGPADQAALNHVMGLAVAGADPHLADMDNHRIRKVVEAAQPSSTFTVRAWGWNGAGQLGTGSTLDSRSPVTVPGLGEVTSVAAGNYHSLAVKNGEVYAWGWNAVGQLGDGTTIDRHTPVQVPLPSVGWAAAGAFHPRLGRLGLTRGLRVGLERGRPAGGRDDHRPPRPTPVPNLIGVVGVAAGAYHSVALRIDGTVRAWGWNPVGELGDGTLDTRTRPVEVPGLKGVYQLSGGAFHLGDVGLPLRPARSR
jgi:sugar lactone lactonase YvrE